jgi:uncharacterized protein YwgA
MNTTMHELIVKNISDLELLILALLCVENKKGIKGKLFLQKEIFLIVNFIKEMKSRADFIAHVYGPYSESVEYAMENLLSYRLVEKIKGVYVITQSGFKVFEELRNRLSDDKIEAIEDLKVFLNDLSQKELLVFIYCSFPEFTGESRIKEEVFKERLPAAISLYSKNKVSLEKAALLAGMPLENFIDILSD